MQIMPSLYSETEMSQSSTSTDYSQDPSQATFSQDLNNALSNSSDDDYAGEDILEDDSGDDDSPYSRQGEYFSLFVPQPVRFTPTELDALNSALMADGVSLEGINAITKMAGKVGGPTLDELLNEIKQSMQGGNVSLTDKEVSLLQTLSNRISPDNPDKLYNTIRYGSGKDGIDALSKALGSLNAKFSKEEISVIGKALNLSEDGIVGLTQKMNNLEGKALNSQDIENIFGDAKAEIQNKIDAYDKLKTSLEKNLKPIIDSAEKREELARQSQMRESKAVLQSRILIEDTVVTRVVGDSLNRSDIQEDKKSEKSRHENKSEGKAEGKIENKAEGKIENKAKGKIENKAEGKAENNVGNNIGKTPSDENSAIANILREKTRLSNQEKGVFDNSPFSQRTTQNKENDKIFEDKTMSSQFLDKKDQEKNFKDIQENFGERNSKDNLKGDDQGKRSFENMKYEYALSSVAQSQSQYIPTSSSSANANAFNGGNISRHMGEVREQVQSSMINMAKNGTQRIEISLNPVELGQLNIALSIKNGEVTATIQTEKPESASMINMQVDAIRAELENQGFKVSSIDVEVGLSQEGRQEWQGMNQHNSERENFENSEYFSRMRTINKLNASSDRALAHNMQGSGSMMNNTANNAMTGLHIVA